MSPAQMQNRHARQSMRKFGIISQPSFRDIQIFVGCLSIYVAVYLRDMIGGGFSGSPSLLLLLIGIIFLSTSGKFKIFYFEAVTALGFLALLTINTSIAKNLSFSNYLVAPIVALVISKSARPTFVFFMIFHATLSVLVQAYEHLSGAYLFAVTAEDGTVLDSELFSGHAGIMRAKGLFQGPLSAVAFYILISLIHNRTRTMLIAIAGAVLAYGRLGIIITFSLFTARIFSESGVVRNLFFTLFAAGFIILAPEFITLPSFFASAFDLSSSNNSARIYFWTENLRHYSNYPMVNAAFGNLGYANRVIGSSESDFIRILMDAGFLTLLLYMIYLASVFRKATRIGYEKTLHLSMVVLAMSVFPFIQSLNAAILFWIYIWGFFHGHEDNIN